MVNLFDYFRQVVAPQPRQTVPPPQLQVQRPPSPAAAAQPTPIQPSVMQPQSAQSAAIAARYGTKYAGYEELITTRPGGGYDLRAADAAIAADLRRQEVESLSGYGLTRYQFQQAGEAKRQAVAEIQAARGNIMRQQTLLPRYQAATEREWQLGLKLERGWLRGEIPPTGPRPPRVGRSVLQVRGEMPSGVLPPAMTPITAIPKGQFIQPEESLFTPSGIAGSILGITSVFAGFAGSAITKTIKLGDFPTSSPAIGKIRAARNIIIEQIVKAEVTAPVAYAASPILAVATGEQIIKDPIGFVPSTITSLKTGLTTEPGFTIGMLYGSGKGGEVILKGISTQIAKSPMPKVPLWRFGSAQQLQQTTRSASVTTYFPTQAMMTQMGEYVHVSSGAEGAMIASRTKPITFELVKWHWEPTYAMREGMAEWFMQMDVPKYKVFTETGTRPLPPLITPIPLKGVETGWKLPVLPILPKMKASDMGPRKTIIPPVDLIIPFRSPKIVRLEPLTITPRESPRYTPIIPRITQIEPPKITTIPGPRVFPPQITTIPGPSELPRISPPIIPRLGRMIDPFGHGGGGKRRPLGAFGYRKWQAVLMPSKALSFKVKGLDFAFGGKPRKGSKKPKRIRI